MKWVIIVLRYFLGIVIFGYAYAKVINFQFAVPDEMKLVSIKDADGVTLTFSYFGYSSWFSIVMGIVELVPAILLFFRRTAFLGSLLLFPTLSFILSINLAYDFVPFMKIWTAFLLTVDLILLGHYRERIYMMYLSALGNEPLKKGRIEWLINVFLVLGLVAFMFFYIQSLRHYQ